VPRACRPDAARHPRAPGARGSLRHGARRAVRDQPARDLEAPEDSGAGRADQRGTGRAAPSPPAGRQAARRGERLARALSRGLGDELRAAGYPAGEDAARLAAAATPAPADEAGETPMNSTEENTMATTLDKAQVTLPSDREVEITRSFRAPRALVYRTYTEPELVRRWLLGPPGWSMPVCEMDVRVGGRYRWRWGSDEDAREFGFGGTFRDVQPSARLVHTEAYDPGTVGDDYPRNDAIVTVTFAEHGDRTTVTTLVDFGSKEARDAAMATGMTDGMEQSYQGLERLLDEQPRA